MNGFTAFLKKELMEQLRTYRVLILLSVFFLFGMMSPLMAKLLPEILSGMEMEGMTIVIPEPGAMDAYAQFFKNSTQMGVIVILLVFGGILSNELMRGTLINVLAKGLRRHTIILAKFTAAVLLWSVSFLLESFINQVYTNYLFDTSDIQNLIFSLFCFWLFGVFVLSLIFFSSTVAGGNFGGLILTAVILGGLLLLNIVPSAEKLSPMYLSAHNLDLLSGVLKPSDFIKPLLITVGLILAFLYASIRLFRKKMI